MEPSSSGHQQPNNNHGIIDLTGDDYEPPIKLSTSNNREPIVRSEQPGTSNLPRKQGPCMICGISPCNWGLITDCRHHLCQKCFARAIKPKPDPLTMSVCPVPYCQTPISDEVIKNALPENDYIFYLEAVRDSLRAALKAKSGGIRVPSLEIIDEEAEPLQGNGTGVDVVDLLEEPVQASIFNGAKEELNKSTAHKRRLSWLVHYSADLENQPYFSNVETFECSICTLECEVGEGVMLKNCLHYFCKECICETVRHSKDAVVRCPGFDNNDRPCECEIQDREIRALVPAEIYEQFLQRSLKQGESNLENLFHCQTPNCIGFVQANDALNAFFACQVCSAINCIKCKAIHEQKSCQEYQNDLKNDVKNQNELKLTEEAVKKLIAKGEAMLCPKCGVLIQKGEGCDYVICQLCKLGICYRTKKPRLPLEKIVDGKKIIIDGCHCNEKGKKCHVKCRNCH